MRSGELQRLPKREGETEAVDQSESERDYPAALHSNASYNIFERHVNNGHGNQSFDQRREPQKVRRQVVRAGNQRDRVRHCEGRDYRDQFAQAAEGNHQTEKEEQVIGAIQNVKETELHEIQGSLIPLRIEADQTRIADEFESADGPIWRQKAKRGDHL